MHGTFWGYKFLYTFLGMPWSLLHYLSPKSKVSEMSTTGFRGWNMADLPVVF